MALPQRLRPISARNSKISASPKLPCWPVCPRRHRPTTRSPTPSEPELGNCTSLTACWTTASSPPSRPPRPKKKSSRSRPTPTTAGCMRSLWLRRCASSCSHSMATRPTPAASMSTPPCAPVIRTPPTRPCDAASWISNDARSTVVLKNSLPYRRLVRSLRTPLTTPWKTTPTTVMCCLRWCWRPTRDGCWPRGRTAKPSRSRAKASSRCSPACPTRRRPTSRSVAAP